MEHIITLSQWLDTGIWSADVWINGSHVVICYDGSFTVFQRDPMKILLHSHDKEPVRTLLDGDFMYGETYHAEY